MCDDFLYHHNVLTHHFLFYHYPERNNIVQTIFEQLQQQRAKV
ncbi:MAG: hypothetical protein ACTFAK_01325 [Candidatus Electronema sp. VV]